MEQITAETERGWTKEFPTIDGDYLCRINEHDLSPVSFRLENGAIYEYGCGKNLRSDYYHHAADYEFLGPFTASDTEQLIRLRDAAKNAVELIKLGQYRTAVDRLESALQVKAEMKEIDHQ